MRPDILREFKSLVILIRARLDESVPKFNHKSNLTEAQIIQYMFQHDKEKIYLKDLVENLKLSKSTITERLDIMEDCGYIKRICDPVDKRQKEVVFTEETLKKKQQFIEALRNLTDRMTRGISEDELNTFYSVLEKMERNIE